MTSSQAGQTGIDDRTIELVHAQPKTGAPLETNSIIQDRYQVLSLLGRGGMGSVYHVRHVILQTDYALKVLDTHASESSARRFEIEARAANRLDHPNLIKVHDSGLTADGQPFLVMEYVPGMTLADHLKMKGRLSLAQTLNIFIQVGFALAYAHENGLIHRDLKPSNIMLIENTAGSLCSSVKLVDLGIAKWSAEEELNQQTLTRTGEIFGSPLYMSPEQCMGIAVDRRSDLYSLGCVIYEALTGAPPLMGENALSTMMKHQSEKPLSLKEASMGIEFPTSIEEVVAKLLEKDPDKRYSNAQLLTATLVNIQQTLHETDGSLRQPLLTTAQKDKLSSNANQLFTTRNIVCSLIVLGSYALGYLTGTSTLPSQTVAPKTPIPVKSIEENTVGIPGEFMEIMDGGSPKGADPYMNTGKAYFTKPNSKEILCNFPNIDIGLIGTSKGDQHPVFLAHAKGEQKVPAGPLAFAGSAELFIYPKMLEKFRPGELGALILQNAHRGGKELLRVLPQQQNLTYLDLDGTWIDNQDIMKIGKLPKLQLVSLCGSQIDADQLAHMQNLNNLTCINVNSGSGGSKLVEALKNSKNISSLRLKRCGLKPKDLSALSKLSNLINLDIKFNKEMTSEGLKSLSSLKHLKYLNLEGIPISEKALQEIKSIKAEVVISNFNFSRERLKKLREEIPNLTVQPLQRGSGGQVQLNYMLETFTVP